MTAGLISQEYLIQPGDLSKDSNDRGRGVRFLLLGAAKQGSDLRDDAVFWEIEELLENERGQDVADGFLRRQVAGTGAQIEVMLLPNFGTEAQGDPLQQPVGDHGTEDEDFIRVPTGRDGGLVFSDGGFQGPVRSGTTGVARQMGGVSRNRRNFRTTLIC